MFDTAERKNMLKSGSGMFDDKIRRSQFSGYTAVKTLGVHLNPTELQTELNTDSNDASQLKLIFFFFWFCFFWVFFFLVFCLPAQCTYTENISTLNFKKTKLRMSRFNRNESSPPHPLRVNTDKYNFI